MNAGPSHRISANVIANASVLKANDAITGAPSPEKVCAITRRHVRHNAHIVRVSAVVRVCIEVKPMC